MWINLCLHCLIVYQSVFCTSHQLKISEEFTCICYFQVSDYENYLSKYLTVSSRQRKANVLVSILTVKNVDGSKKCDQRPHHKWFMTQFCPNSIVWFTFSRSTSRYHDLIMRSFFKQAVSAQRWPRYLLHFHSAQPVSLQILSLF